MVNKSGKENFYKLKSIAHQIFKNAFKKARKGTKIYFDYVTIITPDGIDQRIKLDQTYYKKAKRNTEYDVESERRKWLYPESGG
jgi:hypothetical protein